MYPAERAEVVAADVEGAEQVTEFLRPLRRRCLEVDTDAVHDAGLPRRKGAVHDARQVDVARRVGDAAGEGSLQPDLTSLAGREQSLGDSVGDLATQSCRWVHRCPPSIRILSTALISLRRSMAHRSCAAHVRALGADMGRGQEAERRRGAGEQRQVLPVDRVECETREPPVRQCPQAGRDVEGLQPSCADEQRPATAP